MATITIDYSEYKELLRAQASLSGGIYIRRHIVFRESRYHQDIYDYEAFGLDDINKRLVLTIDDMSKKIIDLENENYRLKSTLSAKKMKSWYQFWK